MQGSRGRCAQAGVDKHAGREWERVSVGGEISATIRSSDSGQTGFCTAGGSKGPQGLSQETELGCLQGSRGRAPTISSRSPTWSEKTPMGVKDKGTFHISTHRWCSHPRCITGRAPRISRSSPVVICGRSHNGAWRVRLWATGAECFNVNI